MTRADETAACSQLYDRARTWELADLRLIAPFPVKGRLGLFDVEDKLVNFWCGSEAGQQRRGGYRSKGFRNRPFLFVGPVGLEPTTNGL